MENNANNIDQFYRKKLSGQRESLSVESWNRIKLRLLWFDLRKYLIAFAALAFLGTASYLAFFMNTQPGESQMEMLVTGEKTINNTDAGEVAETSTALSETTTISEPAEINIPASETKGELLSAAAEETILQPAKAETNEIIRDNINESDNVRFYHFAFIETRKIYPDILKDKENFQAEKMTIDSISYPYHNLRKRSRISISLYAAPAYTSSTLNADPAFDDYLNYRNSHESGAVSWSAGADVQLNIKNWYIQTGLNYSVYSNNRNYNYTFKSLDSLHSYFEPDTTWGWVYDPPNIGNPIVLSIDSSFVPVFNELNEGLNQWKYLEIPLLVGHTFHFNLFSIDVGTGFSYGLLLGTSGNVPSLTEENLFDDLSDLESQMNRHNFNYILQIGAAYHLTPQWSLIVQPYYKQGLRSIFDNNYPVDQRFKAFSIKFGLKVDL